MRITQVAQSLDIYAPPEEHHIGVDHAHRDEEYWKLIERLSHQSVVKHFDAYKDIDWPDQAYAVDPADPRWELNADEGLRATSWFQSQPQEVRSRIGLHEITSFMKIGVAFESVLKRGLLEFASKLPNGSPEFRYCYHEVIEESQHSLMFQEFVNRAGFDVRGLRPIEEFGARSVVKLGRTFPELFFIFVLAGEEPIDHIQRKLLSERRDQVHPLLRRIMQIHVTEEARHLSFARHYLKHRVPHLRGFRRTRLRLRVPLILGAMATLMMQASPALVREYQIPREVVLAAYRDNPDYRALKLEAVKKIRNLCIELGIVSRRSLHLWKRMGIWPDGLTLPGRF